ncbi:MAG: riboflavin biosynthesis protein RibF [Crocinitomicaceae bacterium]|nr:riboflavin biosynthesis protein RibF [Crocinitomicaceae bacterium]|tara:strand:- start:12235 stop:13242 length:1008 start_codon:yes stop_codon:yes gene_type:complete
MYNRLQKYNKTYELFTNYLPNFILLEVYNSTNDFFSADPVVLTIGTFDGVHAGHLAVINVLRRKAQEIEGKTALLTFQPHPRVILHPGNHGLKLLNTMEERMSLLEGAGLDFLIVQEFNLELSRLTPLEYVKKLLTKGIKPSIIVIGDDHRFGRNRDGDFNALKEMGKIFGFEVIALDAEHINDIRVSSTKIRDAIYNGDVDYASELLTQNFSLSGEVVKGDQLGRGIGYPTANLQIEDDLKIIPANGAYAVWAQTQKGKKHMAMLNIGQRPTVSDTSSISIEVNLLDFDGDLYNQKLKIEFVKRIRDERKFSDIDELKSALDSDEKFTREILKS